ncbi:MAG: hypothetical protein GQ559_07390 [Desulfobulbaceae bacterium]|nr:hypothetical protein [Desulfobulbaceae bacterium]
MQLAKRDRIALGIGGSVVLLFILLQFILFPMLDKRERLEKGISVREKAIVQMRDMQVQYQALHQQNNSLTRRLSARRPGFSLFSFLEKMAAQTEVKQSIAYMKPSNTVGDGPIKQTMVEMKLQGISLKQLVNFLGLVESKKNIVALKRVSIQKNKKIEGTLDVIMQVISIDSGIEGSDV